MLLFLSWYILVYFTTDAIIAATQNLTESEPVIMKFIVIKMVEVNTDFSITYI